MRITVLNQFYEPDIAPTARLASELAEYLAERGHTVTAIAGGNGYTNQVDEDRLSRPRRVEVLRAWTPRLGKANAVRRFIDYVCYYAGSAWKLFSLAKQDVIISLTTPPWIVFVSILYKRMRGGRVVLWNMDCYPEVLEVAGVITDSGWISKAFQWINRKLLAHVDRVVCLDDAMAELFDRRYGTAKHRIASCVIPNWESESRLQHNGEPLNDDLSRLFEDPNRFVVLYLGNAGVGHEFDTVLAAANQLRNDPITFLFVGGGKQWMKLKKEVHEQDLPNILFQSYVPTPMLPTLLRGANVSLITLRADARGVMSPSKLYTYLAAGSPVLYVGPTNTNVDDAIVRYQCGLSFRNAQVADVVEALKTLRADTNLCRQLRDRSLLAYKDAFCASKTLPRFYEMLSGLEKQHPHPASSRAA